MKKNNYVAIVTSKVMTEPQDFRIYSKNSPDKNLILAYAKELQMRWPNKRVYVMTYGKAREQQIKFYNWRKEQDEKKLAICDRNLNKLMGRMVYSESIKRVAER